MVYGPADHSRSQEFLSELHAKVSQSTNRLGIAGYFNLIRSREDKSNQVINNQHLVDVFNEWVADLALIELQRVGARFTWSNNQETPIRSMLDRVFILMEWEARFPACALIVETRLGSDHYPLTMLSGERF